MQWYFIEVLLFISLMADNVKIFSFAYWPPAWLLWRNVYLGLLTDFFFFLLYHMSCLYILEIRPLSVASLANIFSHFVVKSLFFYGFFCCVKVSKFD